MTTVAQPLDGGMITRSLLEPVVCGPSLPVNVSVGFLLTSSATVFRRRRSVQMGGGGGTDTGSVSDAARVLKRRAIIESAPIL